MIKTENDKKGKFQSWTATIEIDSCGTTGHHNADFVGYGASEHEAKTNVVQQVNNLTKELRRVSEKT